MSETHLSPGGAPVKAALGWQEERSVFTFTFPGQLCALDGDYSSLSHAVQGFPFFALFIYIMDPPAPFSFPHLHLGHRDALGVPCLGHLERHVVP